MTTDLKKIDEMSELAKQWDGECLSQIYIDARTRLQWKCKKGHIFEATPVKVKRGRWCRQCGNQIAASKRRTTMQEIQMIANSYKGKCLSEEYDPKEHLKWQCEFGHTWYANLHNVKSGSWCPVCGHKKSGRKSLSMEEMHEIATSRGGKCLSELYENVDSKLRWMCEKGHVWMALPSSVKKGHWCAKCAGNEILDLEQAQKIAHERGGKCIATKYEGTHKKLQWECAEGHTWFANYANISLGRWCPECSSGIGERICRAYFEQLFGKKFPKIRPPWLINQDGYQMELDGFCMELTLAFEHQGRQHFHQVDYFHSSAEQLQKRQADDETKRFLCRKNNIKLIEVPQIPDSLSITKVQHYILKLCGENGIEIPENAEQIKVELKYAFTPSAKEKIELIRDIASEHGGICLSSVYVSGNIKLKFRCANSHEWETIPYVIFKGHWCPKCGALERGFVRRLSIDEMNQLATEHGGRCLSKEYINANTHLLWECSKGHQWTAIPNSIKRGSWCSICSKDNRRKRDKQTI